MDDVVMWEKGQMVDLTWMTFSTFSHDWLPHSPSLFTKPCFFLRHRLVPANSFPPSPTLEFSDQNLEVLKPSSPGGCLSPEWNKPNKEKVQSSFSVCLCTHLHTIIHSCFCLCSQIQFYSRADSLHAHLHSPGFSSPRLLFFIWHLELTIECFNHFIWIKLHFLTKVLQAHSLKIKQYRTLRMKTSISCSPWNSLYLFCPRAPVSWVPLPPFLLVCSLIWMECFLH